jgi:hypothetical protein
MVCGNFHGIGIIEFNSGWGSEAAKFHVSENQDANNDSPEKAEQNGFEERLVVFHNWSGLD